jgi:DNA-binding MarR family transcriptional regulator
VPTPSPEDVADRLHSAAIHVLRVVRREDSALGLSAARLSALSVLVFGGPRTVGELAAAEQVRSPTMSRLVAEMEADGLVERHASTADRRVVTVTATPAGQRILYEGRRRRVAMLAERLQRRAGADLAVLDRAAAVMEELARGDAARAGDAVTPPARQGPTPGS